MVTYVDTQVIEHLSLTDNNYNVALQSLKGLFLDLSFIKGQIFSEILNYKLSSEFNLEALRAFCTQAKANQWELKFSFASGILVENTPGEELISDVISITCPASSKEN